MKCTCHTYTRLNKNKNSSTGFAHRQIVHCSKNIHVLQFWFVCTNKPLTKAHMTTILALHSIVIPAERMQKGSSS